MVKTDSDFVSADIGPLHYSSNYVVVGVPDNKLAPDIKCIAK